MSQYTRMRRRILRHQMRQEKAMRTGKPIPSSKSSVFFEWEKANLKRQGVAAASTAIGAATTAIISAKKQNPPNRVALHAAHGAATGLLAAFIGIFAFDKAKGLLGKRKKARGQEIIRQMQIDAEKNAAQRRAERLGKRWRKIGEKGTVAGVRGKKIAKGPRTESQKILQVNDWLSFFKNLNAGGGKGFSERELVAMAHRAHSTDKHLRDYGYFLEAKENYPGIRHILNETISRREQKSRTQSPQAVPGQAEAQNMRRAGLDFKIPGEIRRREALRRFYRLGIKITQNKATSHITLYNPSNGKQTILAPRGSQHISLPGVFINDTLEALGIPREDYWLQKRSKLHRSGGKE